MAEENEEVKTEEAEEPKKSSKKNLIIIIAASALLVLGGGSFVGYKLFSGKGTESTDKEDKEEASSKIIIVPLEPFILNFSEHGRYLKLTIQLELSDESQRQVVGEKIPQLRDAIIMLVSGKSSQAVSSPEGKFQLKDEMLFRANQIMGVQKSILKNIYFTEFVMQ